MADEEIQWMSTTEAANHLGVTARTLYRLINEGQLPAYKLGRVIRLQRAEVDNFISESQIRPGALDHLYRDGKKDTSMTEGSET